MLYIWAYQDRRNDVRKTERDWTKLVKAKERVVLTAATCAVRPRFVDHQGVPEEVSAVENQHGTHGFLVVGYLYIAEVSRVARRGVANDVDAVHAEALPL